MSPLVNVVLFLSCCMNSSKIAWMDISGFKVFDEIEIKEGQQFFRLEKVKLINKLLNCFWESLDWLGTPENRICGPENLEVKEERFLSQLFPNFTPF